MRGKIGALVLLFMIGFLGLYIKPAYGQ